MKIETGIEDDLDVEAWVEQMIAENGYAQISMHDPTSDQPGFAFTIGLQRSRHTPDLICMGVAPDIAAQIFALIIEAHDEDRLDLAEGNQDVTGLVEGYKLRFNRVTPALVMKANMVRARRSEDISEMVQVMLPGDHGCFPGEADCDPRVAAAQDPDKLLAGAMN